MESFRYLPSTDDPGYWGRFIPGSGVKRAPLSRRIRIERNQTASLAWESLPVESIEVRDAIRDHVQMRLQCYVQLLIYVNNSHLSFRSTAAPDQVTSRGKNDGAEEAHAHLLAGIACTTAVEFREKGVQARWVTLAGDSHLGKAFQMTHRLWPIVNKVDQVFECNRFGPSGITMRDFALEQVRQVASGSLLPSAAFRMFVDAHKLACEERLQIADSCDEERSVLQHYHGVLELYRSRLNDKPRQFVQYIALCGRQSPDSPEAAKDLQKRVAEELRLNLLYNELVKLAGGLKGHSNQDSPQEQVNALLQVLASRQQVCAWPFLQPNADFDSITDYWIRSLRGDEIFVAKLQEQQSLLGSLEVARQIEAEVSPLWEVYKQIVPENDWGEVKENRRWIVLRAAFEASDGHDVEKMRCDESLSWFLGDSGNIACYQPKHRHQLRKTLGKVTCCLGVKNAFTELLFADKPVDKGQLRTAIRTYDRNFGQIKADSWTCLLFRVQEEKVKGRELRMWQQRYLEFVEEEKQRLRNVMVGSVAVFDCISGECTRIAPMIVPEGLLEEGHQKGLELLKLIREFYPAKI